MFKIKQEKRKLDKNFEKMGTNECVQEVFYTKTYAQKHEFGKSSKGCESFLSYKNSGCVEKVCVPNVTVKYPQYLVMKIKTLRSVKK